MYHLLRSIYLHATSKEEYSILLLGLDNAGKTTLLSQIKALYNTIAEPSLGQTGDAPASDVAGNTVPTVGQNVATIDLPSMYLKIWDVGGQMSLRRLWTSYYRSCHAVIFVVDSSDLGTLDDDDEENNNSNDVTTPTINTSNHDEDEVENFDWNENEEGDDDHGDIGDLRNDNSSIGNGGGLLSPRTPTGTFKGRGKGKGRAWYGRRKSSSYNFPTIPSFASSFDNHGHDHDDDDVGHHTNTSGTKPTTSTSTTSKTVDRITPSMLLPSTSNGDIDSGRLDECRAVLENVLSHPDMSGIPILVLANKQDREDCLEVVRIKERFVRRVFEGERGEMVRDSRVLPVSALRGTGVKEAVEWVRTRVVWNKDGRAPVMR